MNTDRLKIATRIAAALHANPDDLPIEEITRIAFDQADSLLKHALGERQAAGENISVQEWAELHGIQGSSEKIRNAFFDAHNR